MKDNKEHLFWFIWSGKGENSMRKRVYISADYSENNGDCDVVNELHKWGNDNMVLCQDLVQVKMRNFFPF